MMFPMQFFGGVLTGTLLATLVHLLRIKDKAARPLPDGDDECFSLFYAASADYDQKGASDGTACPCAVVERMTTVNPEYRHLPSEVYSQAVANLPIVCIDIICQRASDGKILLLLRRDKPVANVWWFPGGRMYRGETFFTAARRKTAEETGSDPSRITPMKALQIWNTFFADSCWDSGREPGYEGTQTVNVVVFCSMVVKSEDELFEGKSKDQWAVTSHRWVTADDLLTPGNYDKYLRLNARIARESGLL